MAKVSRPTSPLADVNVLPQPDGTSKVVACFQPNPEALLGEGDLKAFLALDASLSLQEMYGVSTAFMQRPNWVQAVARKLGAVLCDATRSGKVSGLYWAVSPEGNKVEDFGEHDANGWTDAEIKGPKKERWGRGTKLLPAIQHGVESVGAGADKVIGVVLTDGFIEDEQDVVSYCIELDKQIQAGQRKLVKLILIGLAEKEVDADQLDRFDNLSETHGLANDIWQARLADSIQNDEDIISTLYGELMNEEVLMAPNGRVEDLTGRVLANYSDGLPGKIEFTLPAGVTEFVVKVPPDHVIKQDLAETLALV